ncbi:MAG: hypothetical protein KF688_16720 [Pirellulales bacterium]|nr:hypothetical protein [Pirellulales bacterium]
MPIRVFAAAIVSAVLMFIWGFVYWVVIGAGAQTLQAIPAANELDLLAVMRSSEMVTGMYVYPFPADMNDQQAAAEVERQAAEGPRFQLAYVKEGGPAMDGKLLGLGFAHMALVALLTATLTALAAGALPTFGRRFAFVLLVGIIAAVWANLGDVVWWMHSLRYAAGNIIFFVVEGALMAAAIAGIVKPNREAGC